MIDANVRSAMALIAKALNTCKRPFVSCSFGKDSSVLLHLVRRIREDIDVVFARYEETELIDNYEDVIAAWNLKTLHQIQIDVAILDDVSEGEHIDRWAISNGFDCAFIGLRAEESKGRRITLRKDGLFYRRANGLYRCCPIGFWKTAEVEAYMRYHDLPTLNTYKHSGFSVRTVSGLTMEKYGFRAAQIAKLRRTDPMRFNVLLKKYPELSKYV